VECTLAIYRLKHSLKKQKNKPITTTAATALATTPALLVKVEQPMIQVT